MDLDKINSFSWCGYNWYSGKRQVNIDAPWFWYGLGPINVCQDGILELKIIRNPKEIEYQGQVYNLEYEAATMRSVEDFSYGTYSVELMAPSGYGLWPSFWLTGSGNWPPEIDIMEAWSGKDEYFKWFIAQPPYLSPSWRTTTNVHYRDDNMEHKSVGSRNISWFKQTKNPTTNYIEYKCIWLPDSITFFANNTLVREVTGKPCKDLTEHLKDPENGYKMNVIFNVWCEDPAKNKINLLTPMKIKNFKYKPYTIYYNKLKNN